MKVFIIVALCVVAAMALPVEETNPASLDESPLTIVELEPEDSVAGDQVDYARVKRHRKKLTFL